MFLKSSILLSTILVTAAHADTIYQCRAYNGESFWSNAHCHTQKALVEGIYSVPDNMPFQQQVDLAQRGANRSNNARIAEGDERERAAKCSSINQELKQLQAKYSNWQYVPIDQVNADQARQRDLNARRASLRCYQ
jgi:cell division protein YceG involved in septum cleavage